MVKVVSLTPHSSVVKECVCGHCGATLQYVPSDIQSYKSYDYGGGWNMNSYISCPNCADRVHVKRY